MKIRHFLNANLFYFWIFLEDTIYKTSIQCFDQDTIQRLDGWYNNLQHPNWGSADSKLTRLSPPAYADGVYQIPGEDRPNPQLVSDIIFKGVDGLKNERNLTALFAFFGQLVAYEIMMTNQYSCPIEIYHIPVRMCQNATYCSDMNMPFSRAEYDKNTGSSPNSPREQLNKVTSWIEGSFIYSTKLVWLQALRTWNNGTLDSSNGGNLPTLNTKGIPSFNFYAPHLKKEIPISETFILGDPRVNENPPLLAFAILFLKWHNFIAKNIQSQHPNWLDEDIFSASRRWVIATLQNIIVYEYIPALIGEELSTYKGYNSDLYPGISHEFQSTAFRYGHSLIPSGLYLRDEKCKFRKFGHKDKYHALRLCNTWWNAEDVIKRYGMEELLMGMSSQLAERDDHILVSDLREKLFGPREFSRQDLVVLNIMRGRDNGLADYNTIRDSLGLPRITNWSAINPEIYEKEPELLEAFSQIYNQDLNNVDVYPGGLLETTPLEGPGPLFKKIIKSQFERIRDSDRFWFENLATGIFTKEEIAFIKSIRLSDIILNVTDIPPRAIQKDVFHWVQGNPCKQPKQITTTTNDIESCDFVQTYDYFKGNEMCYIIICVLLSLSPFLCGLAAYIIVKNQSDRKKRLLDAITISNDERLKLRNKLSHKSVKTKGDTFQNGLTTSYETNLAYCTSDEENDNKSLNGHPNEKLTNNYTNNAEHLFINNGHAKTLEPKRRSSELSYSTGHLNGGPHPRYSNFSVASNYSNLIPKDITLGYEWLNDNHRRKIAVDLSDEENIIILNRKGICLKKSEFGTNKIVVEVNTSTSTTEPNLALIKSFDKYDLLLEFATSDLRDLFICVKLVNFAHRINKNVEIIYTNCDAIFKGAQTKEKKQQQLDFFFRKAYAETFQILEEQNSDNPEQYNHNYPQNTYKEDFKGQNIMNSKLNKYEFADALGMKPTSMFVERMFAVIDKRHTGNICFQDFLNMTYVFANGTPDQKLRIMFDMFDIHQKGELSRSQFFSLLKSFIECEQANDTEIESCLTAMMAQTGFENKDVLKCQDFVHLMSHHELEWSNCGIHFKGAGKIFGKKTKHRHESFSLEKNISNFERNYFAKKYDALANYIEENRQNIFYLIIFYAIVTGLFADKMLRFCLLLEHTDLRRVMGAGICVSRASANVISFVYCVLLLTVCRHLITKLRETKVKNYLPLDSALAFHKLCAYTGIIFVVIHCAGHLVNLYHVSTQPLEHLKCLFKEMFFKGNNIPPPFSFWAFQTITGITGIILTIITVIMYVFAHEIVRQKAYRYFWATHKLFVPFFVLNIFHGAARLTSSPTFHLYLVVPAILYMIDKLISLNRKHLEMAVIKATLMPSDVTKIVLNRPHSFTYKSGQWVQISIPDINPGEYHAFTLTSAPHEDILSLHIKALGRWTWKVRNLYDPNNLQGSSFPRVYIDGPYGDGNQNWPKHEIAVMIGGGIGVTPYASILKDLVNIFYVNKDHSIICKKVYFLWVCPSHKSYEWLVNLLQEIKEKDTNDIIEIHIFITQYFDKYDLRTTMLYICDKYFQNIAHKSLLTGVKAHNHFGRPEFEKIMRFIQGRHKKCKKIGVFSCGPITLTSAIERACDKVNKTRQSPLLVSHFENFG
ncbi:dual oxidase-like isoform X1 [Gordionus sp. m RMFG-2023]|uniref:dual oxidase-like isoform X1 n=2 Tax=Gordionus sp. m RMFG-2023 TaxID=3053472 RepID=UPI0031FBBAC8